jgi:hypothetical protein
MTRDHRRLLELLAESPEGCTEAALLTAHGFTIAAIVGLIKARLVTATLEQIIAGQKSVGIMRVRITDVGRSAL